MMKQLSLAVTMLVLASAACIVSDVKDVVDTVSKGVELLQEIDESGTWNYISTGLEGLDNANGFRGTLQIVEGSTNESGDTIISPSDSISWSIQTDADDDAAISVVRNDEVRNYVVINADSSGQTRTYRVTGEGNYECLAAGQYEEDAFAIGVNGVFAEYSALAVGVQAISVAEEDGTETVNGFSTTRYNLISKLPEALEILAEFPSDELQQEIADVPEFYIDGTLYIDDATKALIQFDANYANLEDMTGNQFHFEVSELGNQPDVSIDESRITVPCPTVPASSTP